MVPSPCNTFHELLAARRRRDTLAAVVEASRPLTRRELARRVAARTEDGLRGPDDHPDRRINELEVELRHRHLPPLLDAEAVTRSESNRFAATKLGHDLHRAERAFRAVIGDTVEETSARGRASPDGVGERRSSARRMRSGDVAERSSTGRETESRDVDERSSPAHRTQSDDVDETRSVSYADRNATRSGDVARASANRGAPHDYAGENDDHLVLSVSWDAVEAIDYLVASDDRWSTHPGYDEAIRAAVLEASK
ncbi:DUF7344 domain-containing protein [Halopelagius fulvigenes]|uniref:DUF7344 domain-containing protein n=1 Tax=Halopelagius fulvigenes TaxID=1198324 RepID=A0ABD5U7T7_9EURY